MPADAAKSGGFVLLEAIVALVILSTAALAFYAFLSAALQAAGRTELAGLAYDRDRNALELASVLNPMETPEGVLDLGSYSIRWQAEPLSGVHQSANYPSGQGPFKVALYRLTLSFPSDRRFAPVTVTKLGYHRDADADAASRE